MFIYFYSLSNSILPSSSHSPSVPPPCLPSVPSSRPSSVLPPVHHQIALHSVPPPSNHNNSYHQSITASPSSSSLFSSSLFSSSSTSNSNKQGQQLLVAYTIDGAKNIFAKRVTTQGGPSITFKQFRDEIFARKGSYR